MNLNLDKSAWKHVTLGDIAIASKEQCDPNDGSIERYVAGEHMDSNDLKIHRWGQVGDGYLGPAFHRRFRPGQVLYGSRRTYLRKVAVADFDGVCANTTFVIETRNSDVLLQDFLPFIMTSEPFHAFAIAESRGSVNPYVNWSDIARYEFDLPPLDEQQRIADLLWPIERHRLSLANAAAASYATADTYFTAALFAQDFPMLPVTDFIATMTVGVVVQPAQYYTDDPVDGVPALRGINILRGGFDLTDLVRFRSASAAALEKSMLRAGDVVIVRTGRPGDAAVVTGEIAGFNCIDLIIARPGLNLLPDFLAMYLNSGYGRSQVERHSAGTAQQHFNVGALKRLTIPALAIDEQAELVSRVRQIRESGRSADSERASLDRLSRLILAKISEAVHEPVQ